MQYTGALSVIGEEKSTQDDTIIHENQIITPSGAITPNVP
jgi:hypothetical protein